MSDVVQMAKPEKKASLSQIMAARFDLEPAVFVETIKATIDTIREKVALRAVILNFALSSRRSASTEAT